MTPTANTLNTFVAKRRWLRRLNVRRLPDYGWVEWRGAKFFICLNDWKGPSYHVLNWGIESYEDWNFQLLKQLTPDDGVLFDIGANVGILSVRLLNEKPGLTVHGFEPEPYATGALRQTIAARGLKTLHLHQTGLSDRIGSAKLFFDRKNFGGHSLSSEAIGFDGGEVGEPFEIPLTTLDQFCADENIRRIDMIKLDVQRHEASVLRGGRQTLGALRPSLMMECYFDDLAPDGPLLGAFRGMNYVAFDPLTKNLVKVEDIRADRFIGPGKKYCDLFFVPVERSSAL
ncbi:MAG TPA: FkbM family methyltransferase [Bdellovibrionales bacterium]|nr:FkbM family methyltransferase [Bdellovibrionales bacterium]